MVTIQKMEAKVYMVTRAGNIEKCDVDTWHCKAITGKGVGDVATRLDGETPSRS